MRSCSMVVALFLALACAPFDRDNDPQNTCTPKTCAEFGDACGQVDDGCGGTVECGCGAGLVCDVNRCVADGCAREQARCGTVDGVSCGTCAGGAVCTANQRGCLEEILTLPMKYPSRGHLAANMLYVTGQDADFENTSVVAVNVTTKETTTLYSGDALVSEFAASATHLYFATNGTLHRVALGATAAEEVGDFGDACYGLAIDDTHAFCGTGGDFRFISDFGIIRMTLAGSGHEQIVSYVNRVRVALSGNLVFYMGTTDNYYSVGRLGAVGKNGEEDQALVTGGALDSGYIAADANAYYWKARENDGFQLHRTTFTGADTVLVDTAQGLETVRLGADSVLVDAKLSSGEGVFRVPFAGGAPELVVAKSDLGTEGWVSFVAQEAGATWIVFGQKLLRLGD